MNRENKYRIRIQNCINTILEVYEAIRDDIDTLESFSLIEDLQDAIQDLNVDQVSEGDIRMVEQATNALLGEFKPFFELEDGEDTAAAPLIGSN